MKAKGDTGEIGVGGWERNEISRREMVEERKEMQKERQSSEVKTCDTTFFLDWNTFALLHY